MVSLNRNNIVDRSSNSTLNNAAGHNPNNNFNSSKNNNIPKSFSKTNNKLESRERDDGLFDRDYN
jgi:hypothetical protein